MAQLIFKCSSMGAHSLSLVFIITLYCIIQTYFIISFVIINRYFYVGPIHCSKHNTRCFILLSWLLFTFTLFLYSKWRYWGSEKWVLQAKVTHQLNDSSEIQIQVCVSPEPMFFPLNLIAKQSRWKNNDNYIFFNVYWYLVL